MNYSEETIVNNPNLDDEKTEVTNENAAEQTAEDVLAEGQPTEKKKTDWVKNVGLGTGAAVAGGVIATLFTSGTIPEAEHTQGGSTTTTSDDGLTTPVVTDGNLAIAHNVSDDMSFGEAFAAAHAEVGPGGVFEWHGELYGTYTAQEWNALSREEKAEYNSHLRVVRTPHYENNVSHHHTTTDTTHHEEVAHNDHHNEDNHDDNHETANHNGEEEITGHEVTGHVTQTSGETVEEGVEILGLHQTEIDGQEVTLGGAVIDGTVIAVVDVDNDGEGDLMAADDNQNGHFDHDEWADIQDEHIPMSTFDTESGSSYDTGEDNVDYLAEV